MKKSIIVMTSFIILFLFHLYGQIWSPPKRLTWNSGLSRAPSIAVDSSNRIHVVWEDNTSGNVDIYHKRSTDGGATWTGSTRLTWNAGARSPSIAEDISNGIHVVWYGLGYHIYYKLSTDGGANWPAPTRLTWNAWLASGPSIAVDSSNGIHVVWEDDMLTRIEIFYKHSTDRGASWSAPTRLTWNPCWSYHPSITTDQGSLVHVVWTDDKTGTKEIFYRHSTDSGNTWSVLKRLTWTPGYADFPDIVSDSNNTLHVVWQYDTFTTTSEIYYKRSTDSGATWSASTRLTWNNGSSLGPSIAVDGSDILHIVWTDNNSSNYEIYYKSSTDSGATWSVPTRLTWNTGPSRAPTIATDSSNNLHIAWRDLTPGNVEIFYKNRK